MFWLTSAYTRAILSSEGQRRDTATPDEMSLKRVFEEGETAGTIVEGPCGLDWTGFLELEGGWDCSFNEGDGPKSRWDVRLHI